MVDTKGPQTNAESTKGDNEFSNAIVIIMGPVYSQFFDGGDDFCLPDYMSAARG